MRKAFYLFMIVSLFNCQNSIEIRDGELKSVDLTENQISLEEALVVAETQSPLDDFSKLRTSPVRKQIKSTFEVKSEDKESASFYIINYEHGGFIIISGDKRQYPVLAFSDTNSFPVDEKEYPSELVNWLYSQNEEIKEIRQSDISQSTELFIAWDTYKKDALTSQQEAELRSPDVTIIEYGPIASTQWHQWGGYNDQLPNMNCSNEYSNGRPPAGCVPVAMGQIMKYYAYPSTFNWNNIPNASIEGSPEVSRLMKELGVKLGMQSKYSCTGSAASVKDAPSILRGYGYSNSSISEYDHRTVKNEIRGERPVILSGGRNTGWWIFGIYSDAHAWICDGHRTTQVHCSDCDTAIVRSGGYDYVHLHMRWGWYNGTLGCFDGWYAFNNFNPSTNTFNYKTKMVITRR
jgi:hypothetical protein